MKKQTPFSNQRLKKRISHVIDIFRNLRKIGAQDLQSESFDRKTIALYTQEQLKQTNKIFYDSEILQEVYSSIVGDPNLQSKLTSTLNITGSYDMFHLLDMFCIMISSYMYTFNNKTLSSNSSYANLIGSMWSTLQNFTKDENFDKTVIGKYMNSRNVRDYNAYVGVLEEANYNAVKIGDLTIDHHFYAFSLEIDKYSSSHIKPRKTGEAKELENSVFGIYE